MLLIYVHAFIVQCASMICKDIFLVIKFVWIAHWQRNNVLCDKGRTYKFQIVINDDLCIQIKIHAYLKRLTKKEGLIYSVLKKWFVHLSIENHKMVYDKTIFVLCIQWSKFAQSLLLLHKYYKKGPMLRHTGHVTLDHGVKHIEWTSDPVGGSGLCVVCYNPHR